MRIIALLLVVLLGACAANPPRALPAFPPCPSPVAVPAPVPPHPTRQQVDALQIRVELAREAERDRANACAAAFKAILDWAQSVGGIKP